jgi:hypothetical protein
MQERKKENARGFGRERDTGLGRRKRVTGLGWIGEGSREEIGRRN